MGTECSLPHSQEPASCPYPEPDQFSPCSSTSLLAKPFHTKPPATPEMYYGHFGVAASCQVRQVMDSDRCDSGTHSQELSIFELRIHISFL